MVRASALLEAGETEGLREAVEAACGDWEHCLWAGDATREVTPDCSVNAVHLQMLLVARARWRLAAGVPAGAQLGDMLPSRRASLLPGPVAQMTLRALLDALRCLQIEWAALVCAEPSESLYTALDVCLLRFGALADRAGDADTLDCEDMVEALTGSQRRLSTTCVRALTAFFYVAYRHAHLAGAAVELPAAPPAFELHPHHIAASLDDFYRLSMHYDLLPASVLQYRHEFAGMFHSVTQVMYWNNPSYVRRKQLALSELCSGTFAEHTLPLLLQLFPSVRVLFEDEPWPAGWAVPGGAPEDCALPPVAQWAWLVLPGRVYLASASGHLFRGASVVPLGNVLAGLA